jgi:hypothetical protein
MNRKAKTGLVILLAGGFLLALPACSAILKPMIDNAMSQVAVVAEEKVHGFVHAAAEKPPPPAPAAGSSWSEYAIWVAMTLLGSAAVVIDRRRFHNSPKRQT